MQFVDSAWDGLAIQGTTTAPTLTNICWPPYAPNVFAPKPAVYYAPFICTDEFHVFPCPHCNRCRCGRATVAREEGQQP